MKVTQQQNGEVHVVYCNTHYNHENELAHLYIPEPVRMTVASKLQQGAKVDRILDDIRDSVWNDMTCEHLVTRQDILNIKRQFNIERNKNDHTSLQAWVEELHLQTYNPIVIFKQQGNTQGEEMDDIGKDDFLLGIQTEFQRDIMMEFGNKIICIDATHNTNMYDFYLITIVVVDEFGEGIPVGWALSNREDGCILTQFFKNIHKRTGELMPNIFMSDDAEQYWNSWSAIYGNTKTFVNGTLIEHGEKDLLNMCGNKKIE